MSTYVVTGGAGFIGSNIVEKLVKLGHKVRVIDNLSTGKFENIQNYLHAIEFICGDLVDYSVAQKAVRGADYILHHAALPSVPLSVIDPIGTNHSMVTATVNLFKAAVEEGRVKRIVQAVSSAAYGNNPILPKKETMIPEPLSPYAVAKLTQEYYAKAFYSVHGLKVTSLRYFNVFGPRQDPNSYYSAVIPKFLSLMLRGKRPTIYGDGTTSRDFVHVDNVVEANLMACHSEWPGSSEVINIGCGISYSLNDLVDYLNEILGTNLQPAYEEERNGDVKHSVADISLARELLGYQVKVDFEEGLEKLVAWNRQPFNWGIPETVSA